MSDPSLERTVEKLRVLAEANEQTLELIAEGHGAKLDSLSARLDSQGRKLDQIIQALAPVPQIRDFIERVAHDHEERIKAIENAASR